MTLELDETGIPTVLRPRVRAWFAREVECLHRVHGPCWPAQKQWLLSYLRAELRDLVKRGPVHGS